MQINQALHWEIQCVHCNWKTSVDALVPFTPNSKIAADYDLDSWILGRLYLPHPL